MVWRDLLLIFCTCVAGISALLHPSPKTPDLLIYNHTPSIPIGFYRRTDHSTDLGALVTVRARDVAFAYASSRHFVGERDRFIKRVAAHAGDAVCAIGDSITVNARTVAHRQRTDSLGRLLQHWRGCRALEPDEVFLLGDSADSFDGRYFGPVRIALIEGVWRKVF